MKKLLSALLLVLIALIAVSCNSGGTSRPDNPDWAVGNYTGKLAIGDSTPTMEASASITPDSYNITVDKILGTITLEMDSADVTETDFKLYKDTKKWEITISGVDVPVIGEVNDVKITITAEETAEEEPKVLSITVYVPMGTGINVTGTLTEVVPN